MTQIPKKMRCIDDRWTEGRLKKDKVYDVTHIHGSGFVRLFDETGDNVVAMIERFEEVNNV